MSITQFKETTYTLTKLVEDIHQGEIGLPEIQRPFVWGMVKVRDLLAVDPIFKTGRRRK